MADGIYISMCGASARAEQLDAIADNLANAQTRAYKASRPAFEAFLAASGASDKVYPAAVATGFDLRPGAATTTGRALDVLPEHGAFLMVARPSGEVAYTRDGRLTLDASRRLVSDAGMPLLDREGQPITVPEHEEVEVDERGRVTAGDMELGFLAFATLEGPLDRVGPSLLAPAAGGKAVLVDVSLKRGEVELGNTSALEGTLALVNAQRSYDASMQAIQTYRQLDQRANELARVR